MLAGGGGQGDADARDFRAKEDAATSTGATSDVCIDIYVMPLVFMIEVLIDFYGEL